MKSEKLLEIKIIPNEVGADKLKSDLCRQLKDDTNDIKFIVQSPISRFRVIEPAILVAVISGVSAAIGALIAGILKVSQQTKTQKIVLQNKNGARLEIPANLPKEQVEELLQKLKDMDEPTIYL